MRKRSKKSKNNNNILIIILIILCFMIYNNKNNKQEIKDNNIKKHDALAIIVGNVENSPAPNFNTEKEIKKDIGEVFNSTIAGDTPNIVLYSATSKPKSIEIDERYFLGPAKNSIASASNLNELIRGINDAVNSSPAESGCDYFQTILNASEYLKNYKNPLIIVYGSGLSDSGVLNFAFDNLLDKANENDTYINDTLNNNNKIREDEYSNITLKWYGAGQTVGDQDELNEWDVILKQIYTDALNYIGINSKYNSIKITKNVKSVKTKYNVVKTVIGNVKKGYTLSLTERYAKFNPDTDILSNYDEVVELLKSYANKIQKNKELKVRITGYQTKCAKSKELSIKRAETIKNILVGLGIKENKIETNGMAGPPDDREEDPLCGFTGVAVEHRTVILEVIE